jgi:choloylglycine hydrolase
MNRILIATLFLLNSWALPAANACSAFANLSPTFRLMGKSYDWYMNHGIALINKRNMKKTSLVAAPDAPFTWISKYGSLTYTQFGRDFPISGMNEKGLAIEILWDFDTNGPDNKGQGPSINEAQWIQYQLDVSADVRDAIANSKLVTMKKLYAPIHYLVCDSREDCAVFEYNQEKVTITDASYVPALANSGYPASRGYLMNYEGFGGKEAIPYGSKKSKDRFVILASQLAELSRKSDVKDAVAFGFDMLKSVRQPGHSVWNMVHNLTDKVSHFKLLFDESVTRKIDLKKFDLSCKVPTQILDLESEDNGDATSQFKDYDPALNRSTVELSGQGIGMDPAVTNAVAAYPESTICTE